jgi:Excalibur calcium-binding domain
MTTLSKGWHVHRQSARHADLRHLERRFSRVSGRFRRSSNFRLVGAIAWGAVGIMAIGCLIAAQSSRPKWTIATSLPVATYVANCSEARARGIAPIFRGQPGYRPALDADNDGVACEPYRGR